MYYESFGDSKNPCIVMLHGANFVQSFLKQYCLCDRYYIVVPHITGFGKHTDTIYNTETAKQELYEFIKSMNIGGRKVNIVGFSLGAQLAFTLICEHEELFESAVIISPWIIKEQKMIDKLVKSNRQFSFLLKKRWYAKLGAKLLGVPSEMTDDFVEYMISAKFDTVINSIDNGIDIKDYPQFADVKIPVLALAGSKEYDVIKDSVEKMQKLNPTCRVEIVDKAAHNIPTHFSDKLNSYIKEIIK